MKPLLNQAFSTYPIGSREFSTEFGQLDSESVVRQLDAGSTAGTVRAQDWRRLGRGDDGVAYVAVDPQWGAVEIRFLTDFVGKPGVIEQLQSRLRLIQMAANSDIQRIHSAELDNRPPSITVAAAEEQTADAFLKSCDDESRLRFSGRLVCLIRDTHRVGLLHGSLSLQSIRVARDRRLQVDYTALRVGCGHESNLHRRRPSIEADLQALLTVLRPALAPLCSSPSDSSDRQPLCGRRRAILKQILNSGEGGVNAPPDLTTWIDLLEPWIDSAPGSNGPPDPPRLAPVETAETDQTNEVAVVVDQLMDDATALIAEATTAVPGGGGLLEAGHVLGRFRVDGLIGQGGMGTVYRGTDLSDGKTVALKVLRPGGVDIAHAIRRFRKEAKLLGEIQNDYVTRLYDVGEDHGVHFLAMEHVDGPNLKEWLKDQKPLEEPTALSLIGDIVRALVDAHDRGVVHRDIKPENILLQVDSEAPADGMRNSERLPFRIKLTDFGIARHVAQSASLELTRAGSLLGTPQYMSPEQTKASEEISPSSDVYALGVLLFELLAGSPLFAADDAMKLAAKHCFEAPPSVRSRNRKVSEATAEIVDRALRKRPQDRFQNAGSMLREIERVQRGDALDIETHPRMPTGSSGVVWEKTFEWILESSPRDLWPYVSNTERLNRAVGLPAVDFQTQRNTEGESRITGALRLAGVPIRWEEHPFEWVEGERMGVLREFESGPFRWFMSVVTLHPRSDGTTRLRHQLRIEPRNTLGRVLAAVEAGWKSGRNLSRVYGRIDRFLQSNLSQSEGLDPFEPDVALSWRQQSRLTDRLETLVELGVEPDVAGLLGRYLRCGSPQTLARIRPLVLADRLGIDSDVMTEACLHAVTAGLLSLRWDLLCPTCRAPAATRNALSEIRDHTRCEACEVDFQSNLGDVIELVFQVHREIREADDATYCIGGPGHAPHVVAQLRLSAGERLESALDLSAGDYVIRGKSLSRSQMIRVQQEAAPGQCDLRLSCLGTSVHVPTVRSGRVTVFLTNDLKATHTVRVERTLPRDHVLTASAASTIPLFRSLFPGQLLHGENPITSTQMTLLATEVTNADDLYADLHDTEVYRLIQRKQERLAQCVTGHGGAVAKTIGESMLAAFHHCEQAVAAAFEMQSEMRRATGGTDVRVGIGVHSGPTLLATQNERLDYFGAAARAVQALPGLAGNDVLLSDSVFSDPAVQSSFEERLSPATIETVCLPGRPRQRVQRVQTTRDTDECD